MKKAIIAALVVGGPAAAAETFTAPSGATFDWYGHINQGVVVFDDGQKTYEDYVDNGHSQSRIGFNVGQDFGDNRLQFKFESSLGFRRSYDLNQTSRPDFLQWDKGYLRHVDLSYATNYGTFYFGQGSMAADGASESDLSGTFLVNYASVGDTAGGYEFRQNDGTLSGISIYGAFPTLDSGRRGRVRYDTPAWNGVSASFAWGTEILQNNDNDYYDAALKYAGEHGDFTVAASLAIARIERESAFNSTDTFGSVSVRHASGLNGTLAAGARTDGGEDEYLYAKVGYIAEWFSVGQTAMAFDVYDGDDTAFAGSDSRAYGLGVVQTFDDWNVEAYAEYRRYELDGGAGYEDADSYMVGARWKF